MSALIFVAALAAQTTGPAGAPGSTETRQAPQMGRVTYLDLEAGAGYSSNPFQSLQNSTGAGFGRVALHAVHTRISERTTTILSGFAQSQFYTQHQNSQQSFDVNVRHDAQISEKVSIFADVDAAYDKGGQLDTRVIDIPTIPGVPGAPPPPVLVGPGSDFLSVRGKQYRASGHLGAQIALSSIDHLDLSSGLEHVVFKTGNIDTRYTTIPASFGYNRQLSTRATVGARVQVQHTDYDGPTNFDQITPQITGQLLLSETMTLNGAVGVSFTTVDDGIGKHHSTGFAADTSLCSLGLRGHFCAHASIDQTAATTAGPAKSISVGLDYSRQLNANQTISFSLSGDRYSSPTSFISGSSFNHATYVRAAADYSHKLGQRWFGGISVAARKITETGPDPKADLSGSLFIRYRIGDVQ
jgi:hypothetical protein